MPRNRQTPGQTPSPRGRAAQRTFAALPAGALTHTKVAEEEFVNFATETSRSDDQKMIDNAVETTYRAWVAAGRPAFTRASLSRPGCPAPRERFVFPPEHTEAIQYMLDRAGQLYGLNVVKAPIARSDDGHAVLHWSVKDRASRPRGGSDSQNETPASTPADQDNEPTPDTE